MDINYEEYFTKYSTIWTEASHNGASGYYPLANKRSEKALTLIREFGTLSGTAIDFGSGPGIFANELANHGYTVTGVDFSESMIELAASYTASENNEIDFVHSNWAEYSKGIKSRSIDLITALGFIYYLDDYLKFAREVSRMLKPGGLFVVSFRNSEFDRSEDRFAEQKQYFQQIDSIQIPGFIEFLINALTIKPLVTNDSLVPQIVLPRHSEESITADFMAVGLSKVKSVGIHPRTLHPNLDDDQFANLGDSLAVFLDEIDGAPLNWFSHFLVVFKKSS